MEYLQYKSSLFPSSCFIKVLNLIINGIPSIPWRKDNLELVKEVGFKPYYKWNTFNT